MLIDKMVEFKSDNKKCLFPKQAQCIYMDTYNLKLMLFNHRVDCQLYKWNGVALVKLLIIIN